MPKKYIQDSEARGRKKERKTERRKERRKEKVSPLLLHDCKDRQTEQHSSYYVLAIKLSNNTERERKIGKKERSCLLYCSRARDEHTAAAAI